MLSHTEKANRLVKIIGGKKENKIENIFMPSINPGFPCTVNSAGSSGHSLENGRGKANTEKGSRGAERQEMPFLSRFGWAHPEDL